MLRSIALLLLCLVIMLTMACKKKQPAVYYIDFKYKGKQVHLEPDPNSTKPTNFPGDIPLYPKSEFVLQGYLQGPACLFAFKTKETPKAVVDFYQTELQKKGWELGPRTVNPDSEVLTAIKNNKGCFIYAKNFNTQSTIIELMFDPKMKD